MFDVWPTGIVTFLTPRRAPSHNELRAGFLFVYLLVLMFGEHFCIVWYFNLSVLYSQFKVWMICCNNDLKVCSGYWSGNRTFSPVAIGPAIGCVQGKRQSDSCVYFVQMYTSCMNVSF